jgi:hypothetical protein
VIRLRRSQPEPGKRQSFDDGFVGLLAGLPRLAGYLDIIS